MVGAWRTMVEGQILRELERLELIVDQIKAVEVERDALIKEERVDTPVAMLMHLKGIGPEFAAVLTSEGLFRHFDNRRQLAAYAGLSPHAFAKWVDPARAGRL